MAQRLILVLTLVNASLAATNKCFFAFRTNEGLHTVPVHGGPVTKLTATEGVTYASGLAVDGARGLVLWSENEKIYRMKTDGTGKEHILTTELQKGARMLPKLVHAIELKTQDHLAFGSIYDDKGGFRVFAFDYTAAAPVLEWSWCHTSTCAGRSSLPVGGSLAAAGDKLYMASGALRQRAHGMGGCSIRWWDSTSSDMLEGVLNRNKEKERGEKFGGEIGSLTVDTEKGLLYFTESAGKSTNVWETDLKGTFTRNILSWLPQQRSWSQKTGVPQTSIVSIGAGVLAVATERKILKVDVSAPEKHTHVLYEAPDSVAHVSPLAHYCVGMHTGGRYPTPPPHHDEL